MYCTASPMGGPQQPQPGEDDDTIPFGGGSPAPAATSCPSSDPGSPGSTAWITEVDRLFDANTLGQAPVPGLFDQNIGSSDPRVVPLPGGGYRMYFAAFNDGVRTATSPDGVAWTLGPSVLPPGMPHTSVLALPGGGWRLYTAVTSGDVSYVRSFTTGDGVTFTEDEGRRITDQEFPFGPIQSPFVLRMADDTYRMYLTTVPAGEEVGQAGGNSAYWMVSATSANGLEWIADPAVAVSDILHPWVGLNDDGSVTVYANRILTRITSVDGITFSSPEYHDIWGADYHVLRQPDGEMLVYSGVHDFDVGSWLRVIRSTTVPWDVTLLSGGWDNGQNFRLKVCVTGSSSTPIEFHLTDQAFRIRDSELEARAIDVPRGIPPFEATITLSGLGPIGEQDVEKLLRVTDGTSVREWRLLEQITYFDTGRMSPAN